MELSRSSRQSTKKGQKSSGFGNPIYDATMSCSVTVYFDATRSFLAYLIRSLEKIVWWEFPVWNYITELWARLKPCNYILTFQNSTEQWYNAK
jgi:hypothetical protein